MWSELPVNAEVSDHTHKRDRTPRAGLAQPGSHSLPFLLPMGAANLQGSLLGCFCVNRSWEINSACSSIWEKTGGQISSRVFKIKDSIAFIKLTIKKHAFYNPLGKSEQTWGIRPVCVPPPVGSVPPNARQNLRGPLSMTVSTCYLRGNSVGD